MRQLVPLWSIPLILALASWAQVAEVTPPANVVHEGIPPIPTSITSETLPYRVVPGSSLLGWDAEKPHVIVSGWALSTRQATRIESPDERPVPICMLPDWDRGILYEPRGTYLIYVKPADDNFQDQIYRFDIKTKGTTLLTDGKSRNRYPVFSNSGKLMAYSSNRRNGKDMDVYVIDPLSPESNRMIAQLQGEDWAVFDWSADDGRMIISDWKSKNESYLWILDVKSGGKTPLTPSEGGGKVFNGSYAYFNKGGDGIYFVTDRDSEFRRLTYLDLATRQRRYLTNDIKWDIDEFVLSPDRKTLAFVSNEDGVDRLHLMEASTKKELPIPVVPAGEISGLIFHRSLPYLGFNISSTKMPSDVFSLNVQSGAVQRWTRARNAVNTDAFREPELIKWKSFDGRMISGFLYRPPGSLTGKRPVIIDIHGGPTSQFRPSYLGEDNYYIHRLGIAKIYPNIRGSTGYGKTFMKLDDGFRRCDAVKDIGALLEWITKDPNLDAQKIMVQGASSGGYFALSVAEKYPDKISGVISYIAPTNIATFIEHNSENDQEGWREEYGDERIEKVREFLQKIAPANGADRITKPAFLAIGGKDLMTSADETDRIVRVLKDKGVPAWYLLAPNEGHGFQDGWVYRYKVAAEVLFVKRFLLGETK